MTTYRLTTPSQNEGTWTTDKLFSRYKLARGVSLGIRGSTVTAFQYPIIDDFYQVDPNSGIAPYDQLFVGGHVYTGVTQATADILTNAGYGTYLTAE